jgi:hypothetical protein
VGIFLILAGGVLVGAFSQHLFWKTTLEMIIKSFFRGDTFSIIYIVQAFPVPTVSMLVIGLLGFLTKINRVVLGGVGLCVALISIFVTMSYAARYSLGWGAQVFLLFLGFVVAGIGSILMIRDVPKTRVPIGEKLSEIPPKFCGECGNKLDSHDKHCTNCGKKIE